MLTLVLLAPAARASDGEAHHNLRGAAGPRPPARVVAPVFPWPPDGSEPDCRDEAAWASSEGADCNEVARDAAALCRARRGALSSTRARGDARTDPRTGAAGPIANAAPHAYARRLDICAVRIVRRRRDVVLRHEGLEHLRLRWTEGQAGRNARALQREEHGRRAVRARGVPGDLWNVSLVITLLLR